jgi:two-component system OmpR family response regulator
MHVLIVEDQVKMASLLRQALRGDGIAADVAITGEDALWMVAATHYDAIVLDLMLPGMDGFETCRRFRANGLWTPVLVLTARDAMRDRVAGLDSGADDYMTKPFALVELLARLRALVRRSPTERPVILEVGSLRLDPAGHRVWRSDEEIELAPKHFALLHFFMRHPGTVLSRLQLLEGAWEHDFEHRSNVVDVHIRHLRARIDRPFGVRSIETVRGVGYRLSETSSPY